MPNVIKDGGRPMPLQEIPYLDLGFDDLYNTMIQFKRTNCKNWTDESASDLGIQLLWLFTILSRWMVDHMERIKNNSYIGSAQDRESMKQLCQLIGYDMTEAGSSSVAVTFTCEAGHPEFTIPEGTKVGTEGDDNADAIVFETDTDQIVTLGTNSAIITCSQGESVSNEIIGSSKGLTNQRFYLKQRPVVWQSETIEVFDGGIWTAWTRVNNFASSNPTDKHYRIEVDSDSFQWMIFGNDETGKIPIRGVNNIRASYQKGGGVVGNVSASSITELISSVTYVTAVNNISAATGGADRETTDHARLFAPANLRTLDRVVSLIDVETITNSYISTSYGRIATSKAIEAGGWKVSVMIVPAAGGLPLTAFKNELETFLNDRRPLCTDIVVDDPQYTTIDVDISVNLLEGYSPSKVAAKIRDNVHSLVLPNYQDPDTGLFPHKFGRNIFISDLYAVIDGTEGVDNCNLTAPTGDITIPDYKIASMGALDMTIQTTTGETEFFQLGI